MTVKKRMIAVFCCSTLIQACASSAPSKYELNRRSGLDIAVDKDGHPEEQIDRDMALFKLEEAAGKNPNQPGRTKPIVEKVWVYPQKINGQDWMQGTWVYIEVAPSVWSPELKK